MERNFIERKEVETMKKIKDYYLIKVVEIEINGGNITDENDFFEDKITFIFDPLEDSKNGTHSLYDLCEKEVNEYMKENYNNENVFINAFAKIYTLNRQLVNQFDVL
jgi:hypothetical protein